MTTLGKAVRIGRLRNAESGRILTIAIDHAPSYGLLAGLERIGSVLDQVAGAVPDAMVMMPGVAERCFAPYAGRIALILKASTLSPFHSQRDVRIARVEDALRLGADAIAMALTVGSPHQAELLSDLAALLREAERVGLPVVVHAYPNGELIPPDERHSVSRVGYASRLAMELGVDIVKTFYTGSVDTFSRVVEMAAPALVVAAGGPRLEADADVLRMACEVVQAGGAGVTFGRNVWQSRQAPGMVRALRRILHDGFTFDQAFDELGAA
jgi:class I fructose-bisphosphate aldolase